MSKQLLTQEELQQLKQIKEDIITTASTLGELEYQRIVINQEYGKIAESVKAIKERESTLLKSFGQKYGDGIINLETGEIDPRS